MPELDDWVRWKTTCALGLCPPETQASLRDFAHVSFRRYVARYATAARTTGADALTPDRNEAWHWFETHLRIRNTREGKSYKEWIFFRTAHPGSTPLDCIRGGATLLMRDVVREYLRQETSPSGARHLEAPLGSGADRGEITLQDLLPDPADTRQAVAQKEISDLAAASAAPVFATLDRRARIALLARELGLSLAHPIVTAVAGCRKSVLFSAYRQTLEWLAKSVRQRHPGLEATAMADVCIGLLGNIRQAVVAWGRSENACRQLFSIGEEQAAASHRSDPS